MKQEDKDLLLRDLCGRLRYGVILQCCERVGEQLYSIDDKGLINNDYDIEEVKPFLFPMSAMTEEQKEEISKRYNYHNYYEGLMSRNNTTLENSSKLEKCYNTGEITGKYYTGGIVGRVAGEEGKVSVTYCYTKGKIKGTTNVGAVIGEQDNSTGLNIMNNLYYLFSVGIGAINGVDKEEDKIISTTEDIRSYETFKVWIEQQ